MRFTVCILDLYRITNRLVKRRNHADHNHRSCKHEAYVRSSTTNIRNTIVGDVSNQKVQS